MKKSLNELTKEELIDLVLKQRSVYGYCLKRFSEMARDIGYESVASLAMSFANNYGIAESFFINNKPVRIQLTTEEIKEKLVNLLKERPDLSSNLVSKIFYQNRYRQHAWRKAVKDLESEGKIEAFGRNKGFSYRLKQG